METLERALEDLAKFSEGYGQSCTTSFGSGVLKVLQISSLFSQVWEQALPHVVNTLSLWHMGSG